MEALEDYIKPELLITAIALYFMGIALKEAQAVKDKYIPLILGCAGILICGIYVFATCSCKNAQDIAMAVFTSTTQGVLVAGLSTYVNQLNNGFGKAASDTCSSCRNLCTRRKLFRTGCR